MVRSIRQVRAGRLASALVVLGATVATGLASGSATAVTASEPAGGCWAYVPSGAELSAPPVSDVSTSLVPWSASGEGSVALSTSGPTANGSQRHVSVSIQDGPVLSATTLSTGVASVLLAIDGEAVPPITTGYSVPAGAPVTGLEVEADLTIDGIGRHEVTLVGVYFDDPTSSLRVACNGQSAANASRGVNPATTPRVTGLATAFAAVDGPVVTIDSVSNQLVTDAARVADVVRLDLQGFASSTTPALQWCPTAGTCATVGIASIGADGAGTAAVVVNDSFAQGAGTLQVEVTGGDPVSTPFTVLGTQRMVATEKVGAKSTTISFAGSGWDPQSDVTLQGHQGASGSTSKTEDRDVVVQPDGAGTFTATYTVKDPDTVSIVADQARRTTHIGSIYLTSGVVGSGAGTDGDGATDDSGDGGDTDTPADTPAVGGSTTTPPSSGGITTTPTTTAPVAPTPAPTQQPPGVVPETVGTLEISDVRLNGQSGIGDLFGGAPKRTLVFVVENTGTTAVAAPLIRVAVGRSSAVTPLPVAAPISDLPVGGRAVVSVPVELPAAALGGYHVLVQVGETEGGAFDVAWSSFPWGLLVLDAGALAILIVGLAPLVAQRLPQLRPGRIPRPLVAGEGDAIVDLQAAERWWASRGVNSRAQASS